MRKTSYDILLSLRNNSEPKSQRALARENGVSLGLANKCIKELIDNKMIDDNNALLDNACKLLETNKPQSAVILAAGYGARMVPINNDSPKGLLVVNGEKIIERIIKQLHEVGVNDISVVVGYQKEKFEYLIDEYNVKLIVNNEYKVKNNLHSLYKAINKLNNCYIVPNDIWCRDNPFKTDEIYSWYMVTDKPAENSYVYVNKNGLLSKADAKNNRMIGISYINNNDGNALNKALKEAVGKPENDEMFWEDVLFRQTDIPVYGNIVKDEDVAEIVTYEDLQKLDPKSPSLSSEIIDIISETLHAEPDEIYGFEILKKGMTNRSFLFSCQGQKYVMRIPGEGTDQLINRKQEAEVYKTIAGLQLCDDPVYINPNNGYKITRFINNVHVCDPFNDDDLKICMKKLRKFHQMKLKVNHEFDIFGMINFYESLWEGRDSMYADYKETKKNVFELREYIDRNAGEKVLTHIDAVPDNFLFDPETEGELAVQLSDWEYAGMQDTDVDIAMFCIYAMYEKEDVDKLIDIYYENNCPENIRTKIYCYVAACGLLWSNWCEFKSILGVEFGEYSLKQYRYGKDYYRYAKERM